MGASNLWRKSVDETLEFTQGALSWLKADFQGACNIAQVRQDDFQSIRTGNPSTQEDPLTYIPLNLDRLRAGIVVLCGLLRCGRNSNSFVGII